MVRLTEFLFSDVVSLEESMEKEIRHWDPANKFVGAVLRWYPHWCLEISFNQHTLGSFILFCRRQDVRLETDLTIEELIGKQAAQTEIELALRANKNFCPDHFNYLQFGNELPLLHFHGVPRYQRPRKFFKKEPWYDLSWGHPPAWTRQESSPDLISALRTEIFLTL